MDKKWGVLEKQAALNQRLMHQSKIEVGQVANAPMHKLGRFTASAAGEIVFFDQRHFVSARDSIQGDARPVIPPPITRTSKRSLSRRDKLCWRTVDDSGCIMVVKRRM